MRVTGWEGLPYPSETVARLVDAHGSADERARLEVARSAGPTVPPGFAHHGIGGGALRDALGRLLALPATDELRSLTLVPFEIGVHRHLDGAGAIASAEALRAAWPGARDAGGRDAVAAARQAVRRGAPSEPEHLLWLESFLVEQLLPVGARLDLPVLVTWTTRAATDGPPLEARLDEALASWRG